MPRNMTGGSGHKARKNGEGNKAKNNRLRGDALIEDTANGEQLDGIYVGKVTRRMGSGQMEVFYVDEGKNDVLRIVPLRGGLRGGGRKSVWVDIGSLVIVASTGLAGTTHEIVAVMSVEQVARYKKVSKSADERLFINNAETAEGAGDGITFDHAEEEEVNVDDI